MCTNTFRLPSGKKLFFHPRKLLSSPVYDADIYTIINDNEQHLWIQRDCLCILCL